MARYIDKDALVAEIDRQKIGYNVDGKHSVEYNTTRKILNILDTLEVQEIDLGRESMKKNYPPKGEFYMYPQYDEEDNLIGFTTDYEGETIYGDTITYKVDFRKYKFTDDVDLYQIAYGSIKFDVDGQYSFTDMINTGQKEDPIDAAFQMVCWLKENGKI